MDSKIIKKEGNKIILKIEIDKDKVNGKLREVYNDISYQVKIPGFRKGKIPRNILNLHLGKEYFYGKSAESLIQESYSGAIKEVNIEPIDQPEIKIVQNKEDMPLIYEATVQVRPEVKLGSLEGITIEKKNTKVKKSDVEDEIKRIQESQAKLKVVKERTTKEGDFVIIDSEGYVNGKVIKGSKFEKQLIQLGKNTIPEISKQLLDCSPGDEKEVKVIIPEDDKNKDMAGKEVTYKVKIHEIKEKELPRLNDDFAKIVGNYKSLDELKKNIKENLEKKAETMSKDNYEYELLEKVASVCKVEIPEVLIKREIDYMMKNLESDLKSKNISLKDYYKTIKVDEKKLREEYRSTAEQRIKKELILDKIAKEEKIEVDDKEIKEKINDIAKEIKQDPLKVEATFKKNDNIDGLKERIKRERIIDLLSKKINIKNTKKEDKSK
jgi:trigger factor